MTVPTPEPEIAPVVENPTAETPPPVTNSLAKHRLRPAGVTAAASATAAATRIATAARKPHGQLAVGGAMIITMVGITALLGAILVPASATPRPGAQASESATAEPTPSESTFAASPSPTPSASASPITANSGLTEWADRLATKVEIPPVALRAYGYAEWVLSQRKPTCRLSWTTLAAIGKVESNHGRIGASSLGADGRALPPIVGPPLDGKGGRKKITDTDAGALDNDRAFDHAVGPMQFIPKTWRAFGIDADGDGIIDPSDIDDAALAAANQLCASGKDLSVIANWRAAILGYNNVSQYLLDVYTAANTYGQKSRG